MQHLTHLLKLSVTENVAIVREQLNCFQELTIIQMRQSENWENYSLVGLLATPFFLSCPSPGVCRGASVHALLCHQAADGEGTHRRHHRRSPLLPQRGQAHQATD